MVLVHATKVKPESAEIVISGSRLELCETLEQLAWLGATFRKPNPQGSTVSLSYAKLASTPPQPPEGSSTVFDLTLHDLRTVTFEAGTSGTCWVSLLRRSVLACGFPPREREEGFLGLEISFQLMTHLAGVHYPVEHHNEHHKGIILEGRPKHNSVATSMLIPTKRVNNSIQWHLLETKSDGSSPAVPHSRFYTTDIEELINSTTFLGYCGAVKVRIGTRNFHQQIQPSGLPEASRDENSSTSFSEFGSKLAGAAETIVAEAFAKFAKFFGSKPENLSIRKEQNTIISNTQPPLRAVFGSKPENICIRNEQNTIISNTQPPLRPLVGSKPQDILIRNSQSMNISSPRDIRHKAFERAAKQPLLLYDSGAHRAWLVSELSVALQMTHNHLDNKEFIWPDVRHKLEYAEQADDGGYAALHAVKQCDEVKLPHGKIFGSTVKSFLDLIEARKVSPFPRRARGWDFTDLQNSNFLLREKELTDADISGQSWWDLTKMDSILVLFGQNFGEVIKPDRSKISVCSFWKRVPKGSGLLTASMHCLATLAGTSDESGLYWDRPDDSMLFKECQKPGPCRPMRNLTIKKITKGHCLPATPEPHGAVIFGSFDGVPEACEPLKKKWERKDEIQWSLIMCTGSILIMYFFFLEF
jgi:hypothetical protein